MATWRSAAGPEAQTRGSPSGGSSRSRSRPAAWTRSIKNHTHTFDFGVRLLTDMRSPSLPSLLTLYARALNYSRSTKADHSHCNSAIPPVLFSRSLLNEPGTPPDFLNDMIYVAPRQYARPMFNAADCRCASARLLLDAATSASTGGSCSRQDRDIRTLRSRAFSGYSEANRYEHAHYGGARSQVHNVTSSLGCVYLG